MKLRLHVKHTTHFYPITLIATAIGGNMRIMKKGKGTSRNAKRYVINFRLDEWIRAIAIIFNFHREPPWFEFFKLKYYQHVWILFSDSFIGSRSAAAKPSLIGNSSFYSNEIFKKKWCYKYYFIMIF